MVHWRTRRGIPGVAWGTRATSPSGSGRCSRAYAVLGRGEPSLHHARRSLEICEANDLRDFHITAAYEAMARAHATARDTTALREWKAKAKAALDNVADADDREIMSGDVATLP